MVAGYRVSGLQGRSESNDTPPLVGIPPLRKGRLRYTRRGEKNFLLKSLGSLFAKAGFEVSEKITGSEVLRRYFNSSHCLVRLGAVVPVTVMCRCAV